MKVYDASEHDWRLKENREEAFRRYFFTQLNANEVEPDIPVERWIADKHQWGPEQLCGLAFFHGALIAGPTEAILTQIAPVLDVQGIRRVQEFFENNKKRLVFSPDARYRRIYFQDFMDSVADSIKPYGTLLKYVQAHTNEATPEKSYLNLKNHCMHDWKQWGRMASWDFAEGLYGFLDTNVNAPTMEFGSGAETIMQGWAFCIGRDDLVSKIERDETIDRATVQAMEDSVTGFIEQFQSKYGNQVHWPNLLRRFQLETTCCNFKRQSKRSRYAVCYIDIQWDEIKASRTRWPEFNWLWDDYIAGRSQMLNNDFLYEKSKWFTPNDLAYQKSWHESFNQYGCMPRVDDFFAGNEQTWISLPYTRWARIGSLGWLK